TDSPIFPCLKIIVFLHGRSSVFSLNLLMSLDSALKSFFSLIYLDDVTATALTLIDVIRKEQAAENEVKINLSGSLRTAGIAAYLAAQTTETKAYIGLPEYKNGKITGIRSVKEAPRLPLKKLSKEKKEILVKLKNTETLLEELMKEKTESERSRISYHLSDLKKDGLIETSRKGRNIKAKLTDAGRLYAHKID
ncbi:MAG: helix-turn-helix transcriptional regulator, partial [Candidatus Altiarchaeota archaeon]|nr:helix-turn-helix transcriptional regulator [Candidatus Altiarchaeota archaeon]